MALTTWKTPPELSSSLPSLVFVFLTTMSLVLRTVLFPYRMSLSGLTDLHPFAPIHRIPSTRYPAQIAIRDISFHLQPSFLQLPPLPAACRAPNFSELLMLFIEAKSAHITPAVLRSPCPISALCCMVARWSLAWHSPHPNQMASRVDNQGPDREQGLDVFHEVNQNSDLGFLHHSC